MHRRLFLHRYLCSLNINDSNKTLKVRCRYIVIAQYNKNAMVFFYGLNNRMGPVQSSAYTRRKTYTGPDDAMLCAKLKVYATVVAAMACSVRVTCFAVTSTSGVVDALQPYRRAGCFKLLVPDLLLLVVYPAHMYEYMAIYYIYTCVYIYIYICTCVYICVCENHICNLCLYMYVTLWVVCTAI